MEHIKSNFSSSKKLLFLFICSYLFLYMFPFPLDGIPFIGDVIYYYSNFIDFISIWLGTNLFGIKSLERIEMTGSGDTTLDYVRILTIILISFFFSIIGFLLLKKQKKYDGLKEWLTVYARYYLALYMLSYGLAKVFDGQFSIPNINRLDQSFGNASPMGLLWTFMGYSKSYTIFSGIGELVGGYLLFFRRTTVLGSLITIIIMLNVAMLNFSYDVPVKLFSCHLVIISLYVLGPNIKLLYHVFILSKPITLINNKLIFDKKWMRICRVIFKVLIVSCVPILIIIQLFNINEEKPTHNLKGLYTVEQFIINKDTIAPLTTNAIRWNKMIIENEYLKIKTMLDSTKSFQLSVDTVRTTINLTSKRDSSINYRWNYKNLSNKIFIVNGVYLKDSISVRFRKKAITDFLLINRGFHWINEQPFNR